MVDISKMHLFTIGEVYQGCLSRREKNEPAVHLCIDYNSFNCHIVKKELDP